MQHRTTLPLILGLCSLTTICSAGQRTSYPRPRIVASHAETVSTPTGMIPLTTIFTPETAGLFRLTAYMVETVASPNCDPSGNCGTLNMAVYWTDGGGPEYEFAINAYYFGFCPCIRQSNVVQMRLNAGTPLAYQVYGVSDLGATYEFYYVVEQIQ